MSDSCQRQRTGFPSLIGSPHVGGCCASLRLLCPTPVQLPPQRRVINAIGFESSVNSEIDMQVQQQPALNGHTTIQSLPIELISTIFVLGCELDNPYVDSPFLLKPDQEYKPVPSSNFQDTVYQVCKKWRDIAESTQSLWNTLHFRHPSHLFRAKVYLARSGPYKLFNIFIDTVAAEDHEVGLTLYHKELNSIFQIIVPHISRWRAFHLKVSDNECKGIARLHLGTCGPAPRLETLQLYHFENYGSSQQLHLATYRPPVIIFKNSLPELKNISLIGVNLGWDDCPFLSNLHNLELALHSQNVRPDYRYWAQILQSSPEMKTMSLHYSGPTVASGDPSQAWPSTEHRIQLQVLRELNLTDLDPRYLCDLMERLHLPNLRRLTLELPDQEDYTQDYTSFITLLVGLPTQPTAIPNGMLSSSSSNPSHSHATQNPAANPPIISLANLEVLTIRALACTLTSWVALLQTLTGLRSLEVDFSRVESVFWAVFTEEGEYLINTPSTSTTTKKQVTPILLPSLERFKLTGVSGADIIAALAYRHKHLSRSGITLQEWTVGWSEHRRAKDSELDVLIDQGFWIPEEGSGKDKVIIKNYQEEEEEEEEEGSSDGEEDGKEPDGSENNGEEFDESDD